jgi:hypothetical protein
MSRDSNSLKAFLEFTNSSETDDFTKQLLSSLDFKFESLDYGLPSPSSPSSSSPSSHQTVSLEEKEEVQVKFPSMKRKPGLRKVLSKSSLSAMDFEKLSAIPMDEKEVTPALSPTANERQAIPSMDFCKEEKNSAAFEPALKSSEARFTNATPSDLTSARAASISSTKDDFESLLISTATKRVSAFPEGVSGLEYVWIFEVISRYQTWI